MEKLALFLNQNGFNVQTPRLAGHGTVPFDLKDKNWQDWYKCISRSIIIASLQYKKIYIVGFSTGGLLALLSTKTLQRVCKCSLYKCRSSSKWFKNQNFTSLLFLFGMI